MKKALIKCVNADCHLFRAFFAEMMGIDRFPNKRGKMKI